MFAVAPFALETLGVLLLFVFLVALSFAYEQTLGLLIRELVTLFDNWSVSILNYSIGLSLLTGPLEAVDNAIRAALGTGISWSQYAFHQSVRWLTSCLLAIADSTELVAQETLKALSVLVNHTIPGLIESELAPYLWVLNHTKAALEALEHAAAHALPAATTIIERNVTTVEHVTVRKVTEIIHAGGIAVPLPFPTPWPRISELERAAGWARGEINRLSKLLTPAAIIGLVGAVTFSAFDLGWLRCKGVNRLGRSLCGLSGLLEQLALDAVGALAIADVCQVLNAMLAAVKDAQPVFDLIGQGVDDLLKCQRAQRPPTIAVVAAGLPPAQGYAALPTVG